MGKVLPAVGIAGSVVAALCAAVFVQDLAVMAGSLLAIVGAVVLVLQRRLSGVVAGIVALALAVVAFMSLPGGITTEGGQAGLGALSGHATALAVTAALSVPAATAWVRCKSAEPRWLAYAGAAAAALAVVVAFLSPDDLADHGKAPALATALLALLAMAAPIAALRGSDEDAPPLPPPPEPLARKAETRALTSAAPGKRT